MVYLVYLHDNGALTSTCCIRLHRFLSSSVRIVSVMDKMDKAEKLVHKGYGLQAYKALHGEKNFEVRLPTWTELREESLLPPLPVDGPAGAPKKGPRKKARLPGKGDDNQRPVPGHDRIAIPVASPASNGLVPAASMPAGAAPLDSRVCGALASDSCNQQHGTGQGAARSDSALAGDRSSSTGPTPSQSQTNRAPGGCIDGSQGSTTPG